MTDFIEAIKTGIANAKNKAKIRQEVCEVFDKLNNNLQDVTDKKVRLRAVFYDDYEMDFSVVKNEKECYETLKIRFGQEGFPLELQLNARDYKISSISQLEMCLNKIISSADFGFAIYCEEVNATGAKKMTFQPLKDNRPPIQRVLNLSQEREVFEYFHAYFIDFNKLRYESKYDEYSGVNGATREMIDLVNSRWHSWLDFRSRQAA